MSTASHTSLREKASLMFLVLHLYGLNGYSEVTAWQNIGEAFCSDWIGSELL
jgi:hypothetical protein